MSHVCVHVLKVFCHCTARQCSPLRQKFMECSINNPVLSLLMKHLVILVNTTFSAFHWSPQGSLISIGQHFVTTNINTEIDRNRSGPKHRIGPGYAGGT